MKNKNSIYRQLLLALSVLVLASLACSFSAKDLQSGNAQITVILQEDDINTMLEHSSNDIEDEDVLLREVTEVDMKDGYLRVFGTYDKADGSTGTGSYDLAVTAEDGGLKAEITGVDIEGVAMGDRRINRLNEEITESLERSARESKGEVEFESVEVTDDALTIKVNTYWGHQ